MSCLAEQARILVEEALENNLGFRAFNEGWNRWHMCSLCELCEQSYHGVVRCALGWACWKAYLGRPELDLARRLAMSVLGNAVCAAGHHEDASSVKKAELSMLRRFRAPEATILIALGNLSNVYTQLGRCEEALQLRRDVYLGTLELKGEEQRETLIYASNLAASLFDLMHFEEAKKLLSKTILVARHVFGDCDVVTLDVRKNYAMALYDDPGATLDNLRESVATLDQLDRDARRVLGISHPTVVGIEEALQEARAALRARETPSGPF